MASRRVPYTSRRPEQFEPTAVRAQFLADVLSGRVTASRLYEGRDARGNLTLEYDDPTGTGPRGDAQGETRDKLEGR